MARFEAQIPEVKSLLQGVSETLQPLTALQPAFIPFRRPNWQNLRPGGIVQFILASQKTTALANREPPDPIVFVETLPESRSHEFWVSWMLEWEAAGDSIFFLNHASLKLFMAPRGVGRPDALMMRAEWGPFSEGIYNVGEAAAQPHWHIVANIAKLDNMIYVDDDIVVDDRMCISDIHIPMAGWRHADDSPRCWQARIDEAESLSQPFLEWARAVTAYLPTQLILTQS